MRQTKLIQIKFRFDCDSECFQCSFLPHFDVFNSEKTWCIAFGWFFWVIEFWINAENYIS